MAERDARAWRFGFLVDLETGRAASWTDAPSPPVSHSAPPIWIDGGRQVIFPAAFESLAAAKPDHDATIPPVALGLNTSCCHIP